MRKEHHRRLERLYLAAPMNRSTAPEIHVGKGEAHVVVPLAPEQHHGGGAVHGSFLFRVLDDAAFFAAQSLVDERLLATASFHVHFLRPARDGRLEATGKVVQHTRTLLVAEAVATDAHRREIARGSGTFVPSRIRLDDLSDYALP